jgi:hypothetical protein
VGFTQTDTNIVRKVIHCNFNDYSNDLVKKEVDTNLSTFYYYGLDGRSEFASLGNPGLAFGTMVLNSPNFGFVTGETSFDNNYQSFGDNKVYQSNIPFARVSYSSGPKKYQNFDVFYTQNISSKFNLTVGYKTFGSTGFYVNQSTIGRRFNIQNSFKSRKNKYGYYIKFSVASGYATENGGVSSDSVYNSLVELSPFNPDNNKLKVTVWQENAINHYDKRLLNISQFYKLGKSDSTNSINKGAFIVMNNEGFTNDSWYDDKLPDSNYYSGFDVKVDSNDLVYDSFHNFGLRNKLFFKYAFENNPTVLRVGLNSNYFKNTNVIDENSINETSLFGSISNVYFSKIGLFASFNKGVNGFNSSGYNGNIKLNSSFLSDLITVRFDMLFNHSLPSSKHLKYSGSHVNWDYSLKYVSNNDYLLSINMDSVGINLTSKLSMVKNYVYYGSDLKPKQFDDSFNYYYVTLNKHLVLGSYNFDFSITFQDVTNKAPVNVPNWIGKVSVYYQRFLFDNAMEFRYGVDYWQNSKYSADYYAPMTRSFVYQNENQVGNFPYLNFYISARIKGAQGFVNFQNIGQIMFKENYMMVPYYPLQDFGISFGLKWDFFN